MDLVHEYDKHSENNPHPLFGRIRLANVVPTGYKTPKALITKSSPILTSEICRYLCDPIQCCGIIAQANLSSYSHNQLSDLLLPHRTPCILLKAKQQQQECPKCDFTLPEQCCHLLREHVMKQHGKHLVMDEAFVNQCEFHFCPDCKAW